MKFLTEKEALTEWNVNAAVPRTFNSEVWRRIEQRRSARLGELFAAWLNAVFARPAVSFAYATAALAIGLAAGNLHGEKTARQQQIALEARYIQSIDPYSQPVHP
jgi:hypothetical protein